jgi:hypothetical protein
MTEIAILIRIAISFFWPMLEIPDKYAKANESIVLVHAWFLTIGPIIYLLFYPSSDGRKKNLSNRVVQKKKVSIFQWATP